LAEIHNVLKNIFLLFPNYCLGRGLMDVAFNEYYNQFCFKMGLSLTLSRHTHRHTLASLLQLSFPYLLHAFGVSLLMPSASRHHDPPNFWNVVAPLKTAG